MKFVNPYNFVREGHPLRGFKAGGAGRLAGNSGIFECVLSTITPAVAVGQGKPNGIAQIEDAERRPVVPGPALKGMIRNIFELLSGSCNGAAQSESARCSDPNDCCRACRVFGMVAGDAHLAGFVRVSDALGQPGAVEMVNRYLPREQAPKSSHRHFYFMGGPQNLPRGRKFYYHHAPRRSDWDTGKTKLVSWIKEASQLRFRLSFEGLDDEDLSYLLYAILLEPGLGHKIGHGKPLGLGSCTITLDPQKSFIHGTMQEPGKPFERFQQTPLPLTGCLMRSLQTRAKAFLNAQSRLRDTLLDLSVMFRLHPHSPAHYQTLPIAYPSDAWFWYDKHSRRKIPMSTVQQVERGEAMLDEDPAGRVLNLGPKSRDYRKTPPLSISPEGVVLRLPHGRRTLGKQEIENMMAGAKIADMAAFMKNHALVLSMEGIDPLDLSIQEVQQL